MKSIKLNLGAGKDHKEGWINADIDKTTQPDQIIDLSKPLPFKDAFVDEILLQDVLEHFLKVDGENLIAEISRVLKPGGKFSLRIPNVEQIYSQFKEDPGVLMEFLYGTTEKNGIWGVHKYGYTSETLTKLLKTHQFDHIEVKFETTNLVASCQKSNEEKLKPNILVVQQAPDWGGAEEWMATLVSGWKKEGFTVTGVTNLPKLQKAWKVSGSTVINLPFVLDIIGNYKGLIKSALLTPFAIYWYAKVLSRQKKLGTNCIVMSGFSEKLLVTFLAKMIRIPVVWFEYGPLKEVFKKNVYIPKILYRALKDIPEVVFTISEVTKQSLITDARVSLSKIKVVYPGVKVPAQISPVPKTIVFGHLSRLTPEKGQRLLLTSFAQFLKKNPNCSLKIAGDGPDAEFLKKYAKELGISQNIEFMGFIANKSTFYKSISLFIFPSIWPLEGFGMVMTEAMAQGRMVVAVDNGPAREVMGGSGGMLCKSNSASLSQALEKACARDLDKIGRDAFAYAKVHYQDTIQIAKITKSITDVVNYSH